MTHDPKGVNMLLTKTHIESAKEGDPDAIATIIDVLEPSIGAATAKAYTRSFGAFDADDLRQEAIIAILRALAKFDTSRTPAEFVVYANRAIRGSVLDYRTDHGTSGPYVPRTLKTTVGARLHRGEDISDIPNHQEVLNAMAPHIADEDLDIVGHTDVGTAAAANVDLQRALDRLWHRDRMVIEMMYGPSEMTASEVAEALGIDRSRVSRIRSRAMTTLRLELS